MTAWMLWAATAILQAEGTAAPVPDAVSANTRTLEAIGNTGATIFAFDKAAWVSTDALMETVPKEQLTGAGGYVIEPLGGGVLRATYFRGPAISAQAFFVADVKGGKVTRHELLVQPVPLPPDQMLLARAREIAKDTAHARNYQPCTPAPFNTVVVPMRPGGPVAVYLLTAQVTTKSYMMGGNYRVVIAPDGHVTNARPFNVSCLAQTKPKLPKVPSRSAWWSTICSIRRPPRFTSSPRTAWARRCSSRPKTRRRGRRPLGWCRAAESVPCPRRNRAIPASPPAPGRAPAA